MRGNKAHLDDLIQDLSVQVLGDEAGADALDLVRPGCAARDDGALTGLHCNHLQPGSSRADSSMHDRVTETHLSRRKAWATFHPLTAPKEKLAREFDLGFQPVNNRTSQHVAVRGRFQLRTK